MELVQLLPYLSGLRVGGVVDHAERLVVRARHCLHGAGAGSDAAGPGLVVLPEDEVSPIWYVYSQRSAAISASAHAMAPRRQEIKDGLSLALIQRTVLSG